MDLFSHLNEIKLLATLAFTYFCYRKLHSVPKDLHEDLSSSDSQIVQPCDQEELIPQQQTQLEQCLNVPVKNSPDANQTEISEVTPNSPKSQSQTVESQQQNFQTFVENSEIQKCKPIKKNRVKNQLRNDKFRIQRNRKLARSTITSEHHQILN